MLNLTKTEEMNLKVKLAAVIKDALDRTAEKRTSGLVMSPEEIRRVLEGVKSFDFKKLFGENTEIGACGLEYIIAKILANDPTLTHFLETQKNIYEENQRKYEHSDEYKAAKLLADNNMDDFLDKNMNTFGIGVLSVDEKSGKVELIHEVKDDERLVLDDSYILKLKNNKLTLTSVSSKGREHGAMQH